MKPREHGHLLGHHTGCFDCEIAARYPADASRLARAHRAKPRRIQRTVRAVTRMLAPWLAVALIFTGYVFLTGLITRITTF